MLQTEPDRGWRKTWIAATAIALAAIFVTAMSLGRGGSPYAHDPAASQAVDAPLSAEFALADGSLVELDYLDGRNFRLAADGGGVETLVVDGEIYLHFVASGDQPEELWLYGRLASDAGRPAMRDELVLHPTLIPPRGVALWGDVGPVFDVAVASSGPLGIPSDATVARLPELANAQRRIATTLVPAMNMAMCGDSVRQLTSWWDPSLLADDWAILATSAGIRLNGSLSPLARIPSLPDGIAARPLPLAASG